MWSFYDKLQDHSNDYTNDSSTWYDICVYTKCMIRRYLNVQCLFPFVASWFLALSIFRTCRCSFKTCVYAWLGTQQLEYGCDFASRNVKLVRPRYDFIYYIHEQHKKWVFWAIWQCDIELRKLTLDCPYSNWHCFLLKHTHIEFVRISARNWRQTNEKKNQSTYT